MAEVDDRKASILDTLLRVHASSSQVPPLEATLRSITAGAVAAVPGCTAASVALAERGTRRVGGADDDDVVVLDLVQREHDAGPGVDAQRTGRDVSVPDVRDTDAWPELRTVAVERGILSWLAIPLGNVGELGTLNLYSDRPDGLGPGRDIARLFAEHATVALTTAQRVDRLTDLARNLEEALVGRDIIGQAKGVLMERLRVSADGAFGQLVDRSQRRNIKLREIATDLAATGEW
ncbi:MAG: response regulator receiver and domain protein [Acidimicrobiales bacterium]|nr:response regulator receiver and domain protein [Acidimicrobiales bacterium]